MRYFQHMPAGALVLLLGAPVAVAMPVPSDMSAAEFMDIVAQFDAILEQVSISDPPNLNGTFGLAAPPPVPPTE